jgi:hypothetical protein
MLQIMRGNSWRPIKFIRSTKAHLADRMREKGVPPEDMHILLDGLPDTFDAWLAAEQSPSGASHDDFEDEEAVGGRRDGGIGHGTATLHQPTNQQRRMTMPIELTNPIEQKIQRPRKRKSHAKPGVPYASATSGASAREEVAKTLRRFGCEAVGFMDDFDKQQVLLAFTHRGRQIQLRASAKGWAQMYLKANPHTYRMRTSRHDYERAALR